MAGGEKHAKQTILTRLRSFAGKLNNGYHDDPVTHGDMLILLHEIIEPLFDNEWVNVEMCSENMKKCNRKKSCFTWSMAFAAVTITCVLSGTLLAALQIIAGK